MSLFAVAMIGIIVGNDHPAGGFLIRHTLNLICQPIIFANQGKTDRQSIFPISIALNCQWVVGTKAQQLAYYSPAQNNHTAIYTVPVTRLEYQN